MLERLPEWRVKDTNITQVARGTLKEVGSNDLPGLAAEMAYYSVLAVFPFLLFIAGATPLISDIFGVEDPADRLLERAEEVLSDEAIDTIRPVVQAVSDERGTWPAVMGLFGAVWLGATSMGAGMKGLNRITGSAEERGPIKRRAIAVSISVIFTTFLVTAAVLMAGGEAFVGPLGSWLLWPLALVLIAVGVSFFYAWGPSRKKPIQWIVPGVIVFAIGWFAASAIFSFYIGTFGAYDQTYGAMSGFIILIIWLYWTNLLLMIGAQLNWLIAQVDERGVEAFKEDSTPSPAQP